MYKKIKILAFLVLLFSCDTKPLYLYEDVALCFNITTEIAVDVIWENNWQDSLTYVWDESKMGKIGYTAPEKVDIVFYQNEKKEFRKTISVNVPEPIGLRLDTKYDAAIYNNTTTFEEDCGIITLHEYNLKSKASFYDDYITVKQPERIFATYVKDIQINDDYTKYGEINKNGKIIHIYNINATLVPVSYIYLVQFIIVNDDGTNIEAKKITSFSISGISGKKDLRTGKAIDTENKRIETSDIQDGQMINGNLVFCSCITMLGLPPVDEGSSWTLHENYLYYTGIDVDTYNYGEIKGIKDITYQLNQNPHGGILTIELLNSEIKKAGEKNGGFGVTVEEWEEEHVIEISMN